MAKYFPFIIRAIIAIVLLAGSFIAGMSVSIFNTAAITRQLTTELGQAQRHIKELEGHDQDVTIAADDLDSGKAVVIGRLGSPLETMLTIRGTWKQSRMAKDSGLVFHVTHVNGKAFDEPVIFHRSLVHMREEYDSREDGLTPSVGQSWEIRAFETGGFSGNPGGYQKEISGLPFVEAVPAWWRHFQTHVHGIIPR